jgi:hypothetical protein
LKNTRHAHAAKTHAKQLDHHSSFAQVNDEGTIVSLRALDRILGLDTSKGTVKVQAGIKLIVMQDWLATQVRTRARTRVYAQWHRGGCALSPCPSLLVPPLLPTPGLRVCLCT